MTKREVYPLPRLEDCIDSLGEAKWFSTLDANCGYWQIEMDENDKPKTAFTAHCGTYRYTRMPFGLKNAPSNISAGARPHTRRVSMAVVYRVHR